MDTKQVEAHLKRWYELDALIDDYDEAAKDPQAWGILAEMLLILGDLEREGYYLSKDGQWYHFSESN